MAGLTRNRLQRMVVAAMVAALAACAPKPAPPPPPPPPPKVVTIPPRPMPPLGASDQMTVPPRDAFGVRQSVNYRLTPAQTTWNLRAAYNVAALNCLDPRYEPIVVGYRKFLKTNVRKLKATTKAIDDEFRGRFGATYRLEQDAYMTRVYNYFALPPTLANFCDASLAMATESMTVVPGEVDAFSARWLPQIEGVYDRFFTSYEDYRMAASQWDAQYGAAYGTPLQQTATGSGTLVPQGSSPAPAPGGATYGPKTNHH